MPNHYEKEFKEYIIRYALEKKKHPKVIASEYDIPYGTVTRWLSEDRKARRAASDDMDIMTVDEQRELHNQKDKEIEDLKEEIEILKKAVHIFGGNSQK